ncbi:hypothetical protein HRW09_35965 [Streptomyces lunaelactis]|uniref:hypothetical protein n=1 Tax=Streptomyces lunaelactis TaxID=1535768 RepID=UPI001585B8FE|nr:hypothetical protein [Streptomyces lunaelactis]NUL34787.1 hypothetical protein [Streptomyces lunaelactis]
MSQQGERPATEDEWWNRLYEESAPDTGPAASAGDTLDDHFDSATDAVAAGGCWFCSGATLAEVRVVQG